MEVFVGTSGWQYVWNPNGFDWFLKYSSLNSVELNASFYRFPFPNQIKGWAEKTRRYGKLRWSIKVNRFITHVFKFNERAYSTWLKFKALFEPLDKFIDFYLFQLPSSASPKLLERIEKFIEKTELKERFAFEARNVEWFKKRYIEWAEKLSITWVSVDAPYYENLPREIYCTNGLVYLRMHGRSEWYAHYYTDEELREVAERIFKANAKKAYVYFNNNHAMLENARRMLSLLKTKLSFNLQK